MSEDAPIEGEVVEESTAIAERPEQAPALPDGVKPSPNYMKAIELGHVLAKSGYYADAREASQAAVKVMIGMDLGVSPTAAMQGIHTREDSGKTVFILESKLLGSVIRQRQGYDYKIVTRTADECTLRFEFEGEEVNAGEGLAGGSVSFTAADATRAGLDGPTKSGKPGMYDKYPEEMLFWRCLAKGIRIHFPELLSGQPVYVDAEMGEDEQSLREAIAPPGPKPLDTPEAEALREQAREIKVQIDEVRPEAITGARFSQMLRNAEHSLVQLEGLVENLKGNLADEKKVVELLTAVDEVDEEKLPEAAKKALREKVGRIKGPAAKAEKLTEALAQVNDEGGSEDGSNTDARPDGE